MSYSVHLFARFAWRDGTPPAVGEWLAEMAARPVEEAEAQPCEPPFEVPEIAEGMIDEVPWLLAGPAMVQVDRWGATVAAANIHDDSQGGVYGLVFLLAPWCHDGTVAVTWTDMGDDDPGIFRVQDGVPFVGGVHGTPVAATTDEEPPPWRVADSEVTAAELARLGVPAELAAEPGPAISRHLLARSVARALDAHADGDVDRRAEAEAGARIVLDLLDEGGDPVVVKDTPGWQLQEVHRRARRGSAPPAGTGRPLTDLSAALGEIGDSRAASVQPRLREGDVVEVIGSMSLTANGPQVPVEVQPGTFGSTTHTVHLEVPLGTRLRLTKVYEMGHAECWPVDADPFSWPRLSDPHRPPMDPGPVGPREEYSLYRVDPAEEGSAWRRTT